MDTTVVTTLVGVLGSFIGASTVIVIGWITQKSQETLRKQELILDGDRQARIALRRVHLRVFETHSRRARSFIGKAGNNVICICAS